MAEVFNKHKLGVQDILFDTAGVSDSVQVKKSDGSNRTVSKVNATHIPSTSTLRAKRYQDGTLVSDTVDISVEAHLNKLLTDISATGKPDETTVELDTSGGAGNYKLQVKALGIDSAQLAADSVTNAKIGASAVVGSGSGASGDNVIQAATIGSAELGTDSVTTAKITDANVTLAKLADNSVNIDKMTLATGDLTHSHFIVAAGKTAAAAGGETSLTVSPTLQSGLTLVSSDQVQATFEVNGGGTARYIESAKFASTTQITIVPDGSLTAGDIISYSIIRATNT
jgi:hypothetical protein